MTASPGSLNEHTNYLPPVQRCSDEALIEMRQIVKTFKNAAGEFTALKGITTCFYPGEFVSIVGKSGSGKSTLANMLTGIDHPTSGTVRIGDVYVHNLNENDMSLWRGRNLGIVFQFFQLMPTLTLLENVMLPMYLANLYPPVHREKRALELLGLVGLEAFAEKLPAAVAGGQQQAVAIARALANDPPILIADEPTGNLDAQTAEEVFGLFCGLIEQGKTVLMVTHDPALAQQTSRTLLLADGELINPWVAAAFPELMHNHLLWLSQGVTSRHLTPAVQLSEPETSNLGLWIVANGTLEIKISGDSRSYQLHPGQWTCRLTDSTINQQDLTMHAYGEMPVELLVIDLPSLEKWLAESPDARASLAKIHRGYMNPADGVSITR